MARRPGLVSLLSIEVRCALASSNRTPDCLPDRLLEGMKQAAKQLKRASHKASHTEALAALSKSVGFKDWHGFGVAVRELRTQRTIASAAGVQLPEKTLHPFAKALPLIAEVEDGANPTAALQREVVDLASSVAAQLAMPRQAVLDAMARLFHAPGWQAILTRQPSDSVLPLYRFLIGPTGNGRFLESSACSLLCDQLLLEPEELANASAAQHVAWFRKAADLAEQRPDFIFGYYFAGLMLRDLGELDHALAYFEQAKQAAEALIPPDFNGAISWYEGNNRGYLRILWQIASVQMYLGDIPPALRALRLYMRRTPDADPLCLRHNVALLWALKGSHGSAMSLVRGCLKSGDVGAPFLLVAAICALCDGRDKIQALRSFLDALFQLPALRQAMLNEALPAIPASEEALRAQRVRRIGDMSQINEVLDITEAFRPEVMVRFRGVLDDPKVKAAEARLDRLHASRGNQDIHLFFEEYEEARHAEIEHLLQEQSAHWLRRHGWKGQPE